MPKGPEPSGKEAWKRRVGRRPNANAAPSGWRGGWVFLFLVPCAFPQSAFAHSEHTLIL